MTRLLRFVRCLCIRGMLGVAVAVLLAGGASPVRGQGGRGSLEEVLRHRAAALRQQVASVQRQIAELETRSPRVEQEIDRLLAEVEAIELPEPEEDIETPDDTEPPAREVRFRPPILREVDLETPLAIVCRNGRVAILDLDACEDAFKRLAEDRARLRAFVEARGGLLPAGDFDIKLTVIATGNTVFIKQDVVEKAGRPGEPIESALRGTSRLNRRLANVDADKAAIQFAVYPDSFDEFRDIRTMLWKKGFAINWFPLKHGEQFGIGGDNVKVQ